MREDMTEQPFDDLFKDRVSALEARAHAVGLNFTSICKQAEISRATPDRWRKETPKTVKLLAEMEKIVADKEAEVASAGGGVQQPGQV